MKLNRSGKLNKYLFIPKIPVMYKDYLDAIVRFYEQKRSSNELPSNLLNPTPRNLRNECESVYQSRFSKKDLKILAPFFKIHDESISLQEIQGVNLGKLKALGNYLRTPEKKTSDRNIELLAWLLNFEPRPFKKEYDYEAGQIVTELIPEPPQKPGLNGGDTGNGKPPDPPSGTPITAKRKQGFSIKIFGQYVSNWLIKRKLGVPVGGIAALGLITAIYFTNKGTSYGSVIPDKWGCMMWTGDRFLQIPCDSNIGRVPKEPLDKERQKLQRITTPDTLKKEHIKNVWYRKRDGRVDFYTAGGVDPVDPKGSLRPLTVYMYEKYIEGNALDSGHKKISFRKPK